MNKNLALLILLVAALHINAARAGSSVVVKGIVQSGSNNSISIGGTGFTGTTDDAGVKVVVKRPLKKFNRINNSTSADIFIQIEDRSEAIIEGDKNIVNLINVAVENKTLILSSKKSYSSNSELVIRIYTPELSRLDLSGSGDVQLKSINTPMFEVSLNGAADIVAEGRVNKLNATIDGAGDIDFKRLRCEQCIVSINGAADMYLFATHSLEVSIRGSGTVYVSGNPKLLYKNISGAGEILMQ